MSSYWVEWVDGTSGCMEAKTQVAALEKAVAHKADVKSVMSLPYPAEPRIGEWESGCPSFCYSPNQCKGRTTCPKSYSCVD